MVCVGVGVLSLVPSPFCNRFKDSLIFNYVSVCLVLCLRKPEASDPLELAGGEPPDRSWGLTELWSSVRKYTGLTC